MGIPYSKQINAAFDQVTPLVGAGFEVLQTTKNISLFLAALEVLQTIFLGFAILILLAIAYSVNPDLESERKALVTPKLQWLAIRFEKGFRSKFWWSLILLAAGLVAWAYFYYAKVKTEEDEEGEDMMLPPEGVPLPDESERKEEEE